MKDKKDKFEKMASKEAILLDMLQKNMSNEKVFKRLMKRIRRLHKREQAMLSRMLSREHRRLARETRQSVLDCEIQYLLDLEELTNETLLKILS